jgi:hypothetical protein
MKLASCLSLCLLLSLSSWAVPVLNGDFETGNPGDPPPFWMNTRPPHIADSAQLVAGLGVGGSQAVELLFTSTPVFPQIIMDFQPDYIVGLDYTVRFFAFSPDFQDIVFAAGFITDGGAFTAQAISVTDTLAQYSFTFTAIETSGGAAFAMLSQTLPSATLYIDNVTITAAPELGGSPVVPLLFCAIGLLAARRAPGRK